MRLTHPFLQLPISFCAEALASEVSALPPSAWTPHPEGFPGNDAVLLVSPNGDLVESFEGPMAPTEHLLRCPYVMALMARLGGVWGRSRLMSLGPGAEVPPHVDIHYYWRTHLRIHIPIITNPDVRFTCGAETVHMAAGECWVFDSFQMHSVQNGGAERRVHLVLDTTGGEQLWDLVEAASHGAPSISGPWQPNSGSEGRDGLFYERINVPKVMSPWEIRCHVEYILEHALPDSGIARIRSRLDRFVADWQAAWSRFETSDAGLATYRGLVAKVGEALVAGGGNQIMLRNGRTLAYAVDALVLWNAVNRNLPEDGPVNGNGSRQGRTSPAPKAPTTASATPSSERFRDRLERPVFVVSTPRSGSTLLFETLMQAPNLYTPGGESHALIEGVPELSVPARNWSSNRLTSDDASPEVAEQLARAFYLALRDREGRRPEGPARMLEKTPKNALRVPFFATAFPDADFVFLYRDARQTLSSMLEAWLSGRFRTYPALPGWDGYAWSLLLVPEWRKLNGTSLPEIVAHQWSTTIRILIDDLAGLPPEQVRAVNYDDLVASPRATIEQLAASLDLKWDRPLGAELPLSKTTVSKPSPDKWREIEQIIATIWPIVDEADRDARQFLRRIATNAVTV